MLVRILEYLAAIFVVTQIAIPFMRGTVYFPLFRQEQKILSEMEHVRQELLEENLERDLQVLKQSHATKETSTVPPGEIKG